jgi:uncharacterized membrane protein
MKMRVVAAICAAVIAFSTNAAFAQQKTEKACQDEWRANKAANQAAKITEKAYVEKCRGGAASAQPKSAPTAAPATTKSAAPPPPAAASKPSAQSAPATKPAPASKPAPAATTAPTGANQFQTEAQAKARCGSGTVVWANLSSKIFHFAGHKAYGTTKSGAYMCETDATGQGMRASKDEKHP